MKKSPVAGVAGAARIDQLSMAELTHAELHGKRLDKAGKARAINNEPPVTTTGLDLNNLFRTHVAGAFVPKARAKAMQVIVQFPKELVDGEDAELMLHHARAFTEKVFGPDAIFADRVDRDEEGRHVVDLFIAPKYVKKTKRDEKVAVSVSRHQKELAERYNCPPTPIGTGRALQQALFEYLRDDMGLVGVKRGDPKMIPGPDWRTSEALRSEELDGLVERAQAELRQVERDRTAVRSDQAAATAALNEVKRMAEQADAGERAARAKAAESKREAAEREAVLEFRDRQATEREQAITTREVATKTASDAAVAARAAAESARMQMEAACDAALRESAAINRERAEIDKKLAEAEADRTRAAAEQQAAVAERVSIDQQRALEGAQLALLVRGANDASGLDLRPTVDAFSMRADAMEPGERVVYGAGWSTQLRKFGRQLAQMMEQLREFAGRLLSQQKTVEAREVAVSQRERQAEQELANDRKANRIEHEKALTTLRQQADALRALENYAAQRIADAERHVQLAAAQQRSVETALTSNKAWLAAIAAITEDQTTIVFDANGSANFDERRLREVVRSRSITLESNAPEWAGRALDLKLQLAERVFQAERREREFAIRAEQLQAVLDRAGPALTPTQKALGEDARRLLHAVAAGRIQQRG